MKARSFIIIGPVYHFCGINGNQRHFTRLVIVLVMADVFM